MNSSYAKNWQGIVQLITEIEKCKSAGLHLAALALCYLAIDLMTFLCMPIGKKNTDKHEFITWVDRYLRAHADQPYQYSGLDVYAARCSYLHTFTSEAELHRKDKSVKMFGYHDGGMHAAYPATQENFVIIGMASFINDTIIAISNCMQELRADTNLRARAESRLPMVFQVLPIALSS